jgi:hypothetical protein
VIVDVLVRKDRATKARAWEAVDILEHIHPELKRSQIDQAFRYIDISCCCAANDDQAHCYHGDATMVLAQGASLFSTPFVVHVNSPSFSLLRS